MLLVDYEFDFTLTVSPFFSGEMKDAMGILRALEKRGHMATINPLAPSINIRRDVNLEFNSKININFHSSFRPSRQAQNNFLFYHEVHDKHGKFDAPISVFKEYQGVFTPASEYAKALGINPLVMATDSYLFHKVDPVDEYKCDVVFVGNMHQFRDLDIAKEYILPLKDAGYVVHLWGEGWDADVFGDSVKGMLPFSETCKVYSSAKVGLNFVSDNMVGWGLGTNRLYDMCACGLVSVSYRCPDYDWAYGTDDKMVLWADDPSTVIDKVHYLMDNSPARRRMSKRVEKHTLENHTWDTRITELLDILAEPVQDFREFRYPESQETGDCDLLIAIPGQMNTKFAQDMGLMMSWGRPRVRTELSLFRSSFDIATVRNSIMDHAYMNHIPWTLMIDDDTCPGKDHLNMLIDDMKYGYKVISGWYKNLHLRTNNFEPLIWVNDGFGGHVRLTELPKEKFIKASMVPCGFLAIHWSVIHKFKSNNIPMFKYTVGLPADHPDVIEYGEIGEDRFFSERCAELGIELFVDSRLFCDHIKSSWVGEAGEFTA